MRSSLPVLPRRSSRLPSARPWLAAALALCALAACDRARDPAVALPSPTDVAPATRSFELRGAPGPWWREAATDALFDRESRACLARSRDARRRAAEDLRADAAYRAFLDCMEQGGWRRGARPPTAGLTAPGR